MIGIFDSGLGGLVVLKSFLEKLPDYNYLYLADISNLPYGEKKQPEIYSFTRKAVSFLFNQGCQLVILACNTASSEALRKIQQEWLPKYYPQKRVLGVIRPTVEVANETINTLTNPKVGILATQATVSSEAFVRELKKMNSSVEVFQQAVPGLVPLVEQSWLKEFGDYSKKLNSVLKKNLRNLILAKPDVLVLGCTHYSLIYEQIRRLVPLEIRIISQEKIIADKLLDYLYRHPEIEKTLKKNSQLNFLVTSSLKRFQRRASLFLSREIRVNRAQI